MGVEGRLRKQTWPQSLAPTAGPTHGWLGDLSEAGVGLEASRLGGLGRGLGAGKEELSRR